MFPPLHLLHVYSETLVKGHGRIEKRIYTLDTDIGWFADRKQRKGLAAFRKCESHVTRTKSGKESVETRYFITTLTDVEEFARAVRSHWAIENNLHWSLDVLFHDDDCPVLDRNTAENLAIAISGSLNNSYTSSKTL
ncbi:MAG: ISAs1 family transposase [Treponema sp.]|nr:ISAs1 family transposase [Treponema sp.]